jgi:hypothetical protein
MNAAEPPLLSTFRRIILALVLLGVLGLTVELLLLEHVESATQLIPFVVLALGLIASLLVWRKPVPRALRLFQITMAIFIVTGLVGIYLHLRGNVLFEQETDPSARGLDLIWRSLHGGIPMLAPAAMSQIGLLGLVFAFRHPASRAGAASLTPQETS